MGVFALQDLRSLQLDHNKFTAFPDDLGNLPVLEYLVIFVFKRLLVNIFRSYFCIVIVLDFEIILLQDLTHIMITYLCFSPFSIG